MATKKSTTKKKIAAVSIRKRAVSIATLDGIHACQTQQDRFATAFGLIDRRERVEINAENLQRAYRAGVMVEWLLYRVLNRKYVGRYNSRRHALQDQMLQGKITGEQAEQKRSETLAKLLREHWGEDVHR